jgi:hypothetical protein
MAAAMRRVADVERTYDSADVPFETEWCLFNSAKKREHRLVEPPRDRSPAAIPVAVARAQPLALGLWVDSEHRRAVTT